MDSTRPPGKWGLFQLYGAQDQKEFSNDFWFETDGDSGFDYDIGAASLAMCTALQNFLTPAQTSSVKYKGGIWYVNFGAGTNGADAYLTTPGALSSSSVPEDVALVVTKQTDNYHAGGQGRWMFPGVSTTHISGSYLNTAGNTAWSSAVANLITDFSDGQGVTWKPRHFSPKQSLMIPIKSAIPKPLLGTQRRRRFKF